MSRAALLDPVRPRVAFAWALGAFLAIQAGLLVVAQRAPQLLWPEFARRMQLLQAERTAHPTAPLVLLLGSSRTLNGVDPEQLQPKSQTQRRVFNFAHTGAGPLGQLIYLRRALRQGIRPDHVLVEVMPALLAFEGESKNLVERNLVSWEDRDILRRYWPSECSWNAFWAEQATPCIALRDGLLDRLVPQLAPPDRRSNRQLWQQMKSDGHLRHPAVQVSLADYVVGLQRARTEYGWLFRSFHIAPSADRALRELLTLCRQEKIGVSLYLMPEASEFRAWYAGRPEEALQAYLHGLTEQFGVPLLDARTWADDADFADGHHLLLPGATTFSRKLGSALFDEMPVSVPASVER